MSLGKLKRVRTLLTISNSAETLGKLKSRTPGGKKE